MCHRGLLLPLHSLFNLQSILLSKPADRGCLTPTFQCHHTVGLTRISDVAILTSRQLTAGEICFQALKVKKALATCQVPVPQWLRAPVADERMKLKHIQSVTIWLQPTTAEAQRMWALDMIAQAQFYSHGHRGCSWLFRPTDFDRCPWWERSTAFSRSTRNGKQNREKLDMCLSLSKRILSLASALRNAVSIHQTLQEAAADFKVA